VKNKSPKYCTKSSFETKSESTLEQVLKHLI
jgi:hypothetical protein